MTRTDYRMTLMLSVLMLAALLQLFAIYPLDNWLEGMFFDANTGHWLVDGESPLPKFIFYRFPKFLLILFGLFLLIRITVRPEAGFNLLPYSRKEAAFLFFSLGLAPLFIASAKKFTGIYCPCESILYGGSHYPQELLNALASVTLADKPGHCFPAGHASGGFALMSLYYVSAGRWKGRTGLFFGLAAGWAMGLYQMLKGAHYLSHTITTMIVAWVIISLLARIFTLQTFAEENMAEALCQEAENRKAEISFNSL